LAEFFKINTIRALSQYIKNSGKSKYRTIEPLEKREYYDVSFGQKRVWLLSQTREASLSFNMSNTYFFREQLDIDILNKVFNVLILRHESLRTVFLLVGENIGQKILAVDDVEFRMQHEDLSHIEGKEKDKAVIELIESESDTFFDLQKGPLLRVKLIRLKEKEYLLIYTMHHIISDFLSVEVLNKEFIQSYQAFKHNYKNPLEPLRIQYKDFAFWQNIQLQGENRIRLQEYWRSQFADKIPVLELPYDNARPRIQSYKGGNVDFSISGGITEELRTIAAENNCTLFMILFAAVNVFLFFYTGQTDIIVGIPASGREHSDLENQIGFYLNTLALRTTFQEEYTFIRLLETVKKVTLDTHKHQMYPFDQLLDDLKIKRQPGRHPLVDVVVDMITENRLLNPPADMTEKNEAFVSYYKGKSKFDLTVYFFEGLKTINVSFEYNRDLFAPETITRMAKRFKKLLKSIIANPSISISTIVHFHEEIKVPVFGFPAGS
jgi:hypothetical protein